MRTGVAASAGILTTGVSSDVTPFSRSLAQSPTTGSGPKAVKPGWPSGAPPTAVHGRSVQVPGFTGAWAVVHIIRPVSKLLTSWYVGLCPAPVQSAGGL